VKSSQVLRFFAGAALLALCACGSSTPPGPSILPQPPTAKLHPQNSIGQAEGQLNLVAWTGYADDSWAKPFTDQTGCKITATYARSSAEMLALMKDGGAGQWDMVSASGEAGLRLIYNGDVKPMNPDLIPDWKDFTSYFKNPPFNSINDVHYGISVQWSPNALLFSTQKFPNAPTSWNVIYDPANKGLITVPDSPMQIADAALYLMRSNPTLGITDPYELTQKQFDASINLLKRQRPLIRQYWATSTDEVGLFQRGDVFVGSASVYQTAYLKTAGVPVGDTIPNEGATGWADTWMLATKAKHPNCAYSWAKYVSTPRIQAEQAVLLGETPVNPKACGEMEGLRSGSCGVHHADATAAYIESIKFWKTPLATCPNGAAACISYEQWVPAWASVKAQ
jgi:putative spermidine/putrescine transport system substrate-binding protein